MYESWDYCCTLFERKISNMPFAGGSAKITVITGMVVLHSKRLLQAAEHACLRVSGPFIRGVS